MSLESVREDMARRAPDLVILESPSPTMTVEQAAAAFAVEPGRIAKTLTLRVRGLPILLVVRGDARLDNAKVKAAFGGKASMLGPDEVVRLTGHPVGGVCPFGLLTPLPVHCDVSLRGFDAVYPAAGSTHSALQIAPDRLAELTGGRWVDCCRLPLTGDDRAASPA